MVHLSRYPVNNKKLIRVFNLLFEIMNNAKNQDIFLGLIKDILSPTEQIMISKRIAIIYLINKGIDNSIIIDYLKISKSTLAKFHLLFYEKDTPLIKIINKLLKKEIVSHFFENIFADIFIQPGIKIGHWQKHWDHKKRLEKQKMIDI